MWRRATSSVAIAAWLIVAGIAQAQDANPTNVDTLLEAARGVSPQSAFLVADNIPPGRSTAELRAAVEVAIQRSRTLREDDRTAVDELLALHRELRKHATISIQDRTVLLRQVNQRLTAISQQLSTAARATPQTALPGGQRHILGQQLPPFGQPAAGQNPPGTPPTAAQELIDVIQDTIAPTTWDLRGGQGVIRFWGPGNALIIRQSSDVHQQLAQLIEDLNP